MAIIMIIVGMIISTVMPRILGRVGTDKAKKAKFSLIETRDEIIGYAAVNGNLPVPDTSSGSPVVPKASISRHLDTWGQDIGYIVARDTASGARLYTMNVSSVNGTDLSESLYNYQSAFGGTEQRRTDNVAFIIFSTGKNLTKDLDDSAVSADGEGDFIHYTFGADLDNNTATAGENDDLVEFVVADYLQTKAEASDEEEVAAAGSDVTTTGGSSGNSASFDEAAVSDPTGAGTTVVINEDGTIDLGNGLTNDVGCLWYQGDSSAGRCTDGKCEFNYGIRAFFRFKFNDTDNSANSGDHRAGFTFAVIDGDINDSTVCGRSGHTVGYACVSDATANCILPYKMAVEVDSYPNGGLANDGSTNHVAWLFWDDNDNSGTDRYNDVNHEDFGIGSCQTVNNVGTHNPENPAYAAPCTQNENAFHTEAGHSPNWLEDENTHTMRIEIYRNATNSVGDPNGSNVVNATAWIDCGTDCSDLTQPYVGTADAHIYTNSTLADNATTGSGGMQYFRFGWTEGSGGGTNQSLTISDFGVKFLNTEPDHNY